MATPSLQADGKLRQALPNSADRVLPYRLDVLASDAADVVQRVGGWLFDRAMGGWEVNVLLAEPGCGQPLRILGARTYPLSGEAAAVFDEPAVGLAVSASLWTDHPRLADAVVRTMRTGRTEVAVWGAQGPTGAVDRVQYRLSAAARIFKRHALAAAGAPDVAIADVEALFRGGYRPVDSDLLPVD
ncbi:hypothetical protein [Mycolicibacterium thermoresistibile]